MRVFTAELFGTFILMLGGPGLAVLAAPSLGDTARLAVALGFGFALLVVMYSIGPISGGHVNPAVTVGMLIAGRIDARAVPTYVVGQIVGAILGGLTIWTIAHNASDMSALGRNWDGAGDSNFATNRWTGEFMGFWPMVIAEVVFTAILVFAMLSTTHKRFSAAAAGVQVGAVLTLIHLVSIPIDNTSVNPVRSFGMALFAGGDSLEQLWAFVIFPLVGALLGSVLWSFLSEDGEPAPSPGTPERPPSVREAAARATASVKEAIGE